MERGKLRRIDKRLRIGKRQKMAQFIGLGRNGPHDRRRKGNHLEEDEAEEETEKEQGEKLSSEFGARSSKSGAALSPEVKGRMSEAGEGLSSEFEARNLERMPHWIV